MIEGLEETLKAVGGGEVHPVDGGPTRLGSGGTSPPPRRSREVVELRMAVPDGRAAAPRAGHPDGCIHTGPGPARRAPAGPAERASKPARPTSGRRHPYPVPRDATCDPTPATGKGGHPPPLAPSTGAARTGWPKWNGSRRACPSGVTWRPRSVAPAHPRWEPPTPTAPHGRWRGTAHPWPAPVPLRCCTGRRMAGEAQAPARPAPPWRYAALPAGQVSARFADAAQASRRASGTTGAGITATPTRMKPSVFIGEAAISLRRALGIGCSTTVAFPTPSRHLRGKHQLQPPMRPLMLAAIR